MSSNDVETIKERLNIADIIGSYIKLEKAGGNFRAKCPFHTERTPSFFISPVRGSFHCFGCGKGGDIFTFVEEMEGVDFVGALKILADRAGISLSGYNFSDKQKDERLYSLTEEATRHYQKCLIDHKQALSYLYKRGLTRETCAEFRIGFARDDWTALRDHLIGAGYTMDEIERAGLVVKTERGNYDRFRSRIMFPISDPAGRIVAFSGRIFGKKDDKTGKYVNSPETTLFNKSRVLYGYDKAKNEIRKNKSVVLVEGQFDLLMAYQSGTKNTVAVSGTAFSEHHAKMVNRLADKLILAFDADSAGRAASIRAAAVGVAHGLDVRAVNMQAGMDPADLIAEKPEEWENMVKSAPHIINLFLDVLSQEYSDKRDFRLAVGVKILPIINVMENKIEQAHFVGEVAARAGIYEDAVWGELGKIDTKAVENIEETTNKNMSSDEGSDDREGIIAKQITTILLWQDGLQNPTIDVSVWRKHYKDIVGEEYASKTFSISDKEKQKRIFEVEVYLKEDYDAEKDLEELMRGLEQEHTKNIFAKTLDELRDAEREGDKERAENLLKECHNISRKLKT